MVIFHRYVKLPEGTSLFAVAAIPHFHISCRCFLQELYKHGEAVAVPLTEKTIHKQVHGPLHGRDDERMGESWDDKT